MTVRKRHLNIHNSDRKYNITLADSTDDTARVKVTKLNEEAIEAEMDKLKAQSERYAIKDNKKYILYQQRYGNDTVQEKVIRYGGTVSYYTTTRAPVHIINRLSSVPDSEIIYYCKKEHTLEDVINVRFASMSTRTVIDVPVVVPDISPYDLLISLHPLRYHVDRVKLSFPPLKEEELSERHKKYYVKSEGQYLIKPEVKFKYFKELQDALSSWKMNIYLVCNSAKDRKSVAQIIKKDYKSFQDKSLEEGH